MSIGGARKKESSSRHFDYTQHPKTQKNLLHNVVYNFGKIGRRFSKKKHKHKIENDMDESNDIFVDLRKFQNEEITVRNRITF